MKSNGKNHMGLALRSGCGAHRYNHEALHEDRPLKNRLKSSGIKDAFARNALVPRT